MMLIKNRINFGAYYETREVEMIFGEISEIRQTKVRPDVSRTKQIT